VGGYCAVHRVCASGCEEAAEREVVGSCVGGGPSCSGAGQLRWDKRGRGLGGGAGGGKAKAGCCAESSAPSTRLELWGKPLGLSSCAAGQQRRPSWPPCWPCGCP